MLQIKLVNIIFKIYILYFKLSNREEKMKKIIGILLCMLLIATTVSSVAGTLNMITKSENHEIGKNNYSCIDQSQELHTESYYLIRDEPPASTPAIECLWQEFVPTKSLLTQIDIYMFDSAPGENANLCLILYQEGVPITYAGMFHYRFIIDPAHIPDYTETWLSFDIPNIMLNVGEKYKMVLWTSRISEFVWYGASGDPYPNGESGGVPYGTAPGYDFAFRTWTECDSYSSSCAIEEIDINSFSFDSVDQSQTNADGKYFTDIDDGTPPRECSWQEFVPTVSKHTKIEVLLYNSAAHEPTNLRLSIEKPLGNVIAYKYQFYFNIPASDKWVEFDIPDIDLIPLEKYYIVLWVNYASEYMWWGGLGDPYTQGNSGRECHGCSTPPDLDFCFKTYVDDENLPPSPPEISGPNSGKANENLEFKFKSQDPDGDDILYYVEWGDQNSENSGPHQSGDEISLNHAWSQDDTFIIQAKAIDTKNAESSWSTFEISIPRNKFVTGSYLFRILDFFPFLKILLQRLG
jgi:hypothetical protein